MITNQNELIFEKKIFIVEIIPLLILLAISLLFFSSIPTYSNLAIKIFNFIVGIIFLYLPLKALKYYFSFENLSFANSLIKVNFNGKIESFKVPEDIIQIIYGQENIEINLNNNKKQFIIFSRLLKNNDEFIKYLDKLLAHHHSENNVKNLPNSLDSLMHNQRIPNELSTKKAAIVILFFIGLFTVLFLYAFLYT